MPETDLQLITRAVKSSGPIAQKFWRHDPNAWSKKDDSPVSEADLAVDAHLREVLVGARPDYGWLSEESTGEASAKPRRFIVDPIDGTRAFLNGEPTFAHSVAVAEGDTILAAAIYLPVRDKLYTAQLKGGAFLNGQRLCVGAADKINPGCTIVASKPALQACHWCVDVPEFERIYRPSLAYRMALVAEGRYDAMLTVRDTWHWDVAAGALILTEAGATVTDGTGAPLRFGSSHPASDRVIAANAKMHAEILKALV